MDTEYRSRWDAIGIAASFACAVHCVLLPLIFTTLTLFGVEFLENVYLEMITILVSMTAGSWALLKGFQRHHNKVLIFFFIAGLALMITGNLLASQWAEIICKLVGSVLIIVAHLKNVRQCRHY